MFEIAVQRQFNATHAIVVAGQREPVHGHDWHVQAIIAGPHLDANGLLCDFHAVEAALDAIVQPWRHAHLNSCEGFSSAKLEPTAENVAFLIAQGLDKALKSQLPQGAALACVRVTEAPGCVASYIPTPPDRGEHQELP